MAQVRKNSGQLTNYGLDRRFADEQGTNSAERKSEFLKIEKNSKPPRLEVRQRVWSAYPEVRQLDEALIWTLLKERPSIAECNEHVEHFLVENGLARVRQFDAAAVLGARAVTPLLDLFHTGLRISMRSWPSSKRVSLLLAIYIQAQAAVSHELAELVLHDLDAVIDLWMSSIFPMGECYEVYHDLLDLCINAKDGIGSDLSVQNRVVLREKIEQVILPINLIKEVQL